MLGFGKSAVRVANVKLHKKGQKYVGILLREPEQKQQPKFGGAPGEMATWDDGNPKLQWAFDMLTVSEDICDCEEWCADGAKNADRGTDSDTGERKLYIPTFGNMISAMSEALVVGDAPLDRAGEPELEIGGTFVILRSGLDHEKAKKSGGKPPVTYQAVYKPPTEESLAQVKEFLGRTSAGSASDMASAVSGLEVDSGEVESLEDMMKKLV